MKDLLALCFLIVFIVFAHSWTNHGKKITEQKPAKSLKAVTFHQPGIPEKSSVNKTVPAISTGMQSFQVKKYQKIISGRTQKKSNSVEASYQPVDEGNCPVHSFHSFENNFLCPYYEHQTIQMSSFNNVEDNSMLIRYNN